MKTLKKSLIIITVFLTALIFRYSCFSYYVIPSELAPSNTPFRYSFVQGQYANLPAYEGATAILFILADALLYFAAPIAIMMLVFAGFIFITGGASSEKQESAKKHLQWTLLGLLAIILSYSIVRIAIFMIISSAQQSAPPGA